jgi:hypothetical protein
MLFYGYVMCIIPYKVDALRVTFFMLIWRMMLNVDLNISFCNMSDWKGIGEKAGEVESTKAYKQNKC